MTDGGRARMVERSSSNGDFVTVAELNQMSRLKTLRDRLHASPQARVFGSHEPVRHRVGREGHVRRAKTAFVAQVAAQAAGIVSSTGLTGVVLAAPPRLIGALRRCLEPSTPIAGALAKDLTKTPDHALGAWLDDLTFAVPETGGWLRDE
nr:host attachment protein [Caulobacter sp. CCUG 60055]